MLRTSSGEGKVQWCLRSLGGRRKTEEEELQLRPKMVVGRIVRLAARHSVSNCGQIWPWAIRKPRGGDEVSGCRSQAMEGQCTRGAVGESLNGYIYYLSQHLILQIGVF